MLTPNQFKRKLEIQKEIEIIEETISDLENDICLHHLDIEDLEDELADLEEIAKER